MITTYRELNVHRPSPLLGVLLHRFLRPTPHPRLPPMPFFMSETGDHWTSRAQCQQPIKRSSEVLSNCYDSFNASRIHELKTIYCSFAEMAHGYVGADLAAVCKEAGLMSFKRCLEEHDVASSLNNTAREDTLKERLLVTRDDIVAAFAQVRPSAMREVAIDVPKVG